jgi:tetratricopeptide (TPR) repeat protein
MVNSRIDALISKAKIFARSGETDKALSIANELIDRFPDDMEVWLLRSYLFARMANYPRSILDLDRAISINAQEPTLFYDRGRYHFKLESYTRAIEDFSMGLAVCDQLKDDYYRESLLFFRAEAYLALANKEQARNDLSSVRDDFTTWTFKLRTKSEILSECR